MATILLSAAGAAIGGSVGGTLAGVSSVAIGRAVGATLGKVIDQRLLGQGATRVETGRVDRFRLTQAGEGEPVAQVFGRMRLGGQMIWASQFRETRTTRGGGGGGKGAPRQPETTEYSYSVNLAIAICEGEIARIGRVWADGEEVSGDDLNMRVYRGTRDQLPDPLIEAIEGAGAVPAYRGTAYVVLENLALGPFGNRVPQFSFEVMRPEEAGAPEGQTDPVHAIKGVALIPGTGEYALASTPVYYHKGPGQHWSANTNTPSGKTDLVTSLDALQDDVPNCRATSLVVSWFGDDLRCGSCRLRPKFETRGIEGANMPWRVAGQTRANALQVPHVQDRPVYGGTPADAAVIEAIHALKERGQDVMFYPFILMDQLDGNDLPDPYSEAESQPALPWRGRITVSKAPGQAGSPDGTAQAADEVAQFFGAARAADFSVGNATVGYSGPQDWGLRRFILHYAALCAAAGGVSAFCIGSELRGLTQIRGAGNVFVAVQALKDLAAEVRVLLGPECKIGYAADWSEYFGYQPQDGSGDRFFHLDPLWADETIDFVGIDNYMPLSDWRDGQDHRDAAWGSIYDPDYLKSNIAGGEGYDWFYASDAARAAQIRTPITDTAHQEPWVWRYKDIRNWWANPHHDRVGGIRQAQPSDWVPQSKPVWFTELGCGAIDKATNEPNKFLDVKSSESALPVFSSGARDDLIQRQYLRAMYDFWADDANNPQSALYDGAMVDMTRAFVWAWDARPFPYFPNNTAQWSDGENQARGHWINGRVSARSLASVVAEICRRSGVVHIDTSRLHGIVRGYTITDVADARSALQPLMLAHAFDAVERDGVLHFVMRAEQPATDVSRDDLVETSELDGLAETVRAPDSEMAGRVRVRFVEADSDFDVLSEEAVLPDEATHAVSATDLAMSLTRAEGRQTVERWLTEARVARDTVRIALPPSRLHLGAGDVIEIQPEKEGPSARYRIDRVDQHQAQIIEVVRTDPESYRAAKINDMPPGSRAYLPPAPVLALFMDLPLLNGDEIPHAPHLAVTAEPWPGDVAVYSAPIESDFTLNRLMTGAACVGQTETVLNAAAAGVWDETGALQVKLIRGALQSIPDEAVLAGGNLAVIGDGSPDNWEVIQFQSADLIAPDTYLIRRRLRGQAGTDGVIPEQWPAGSWFVLLDGVPKQIEMSANLRRVAQNFRIGAARRPLDDPSYQQVTAAFDGVGLRPYSPCHLNWQPQSGGTHHLSWIRRTRIDGDGWEGADVPLGEEDERYVVRVLQNGVRLREDEVTQPYWAYSQADRTTDGVSGAFDVEVAQVSARFGAGPARRIAIAP